MLLTPEQLVQQIHDSPTRLVLAVSGGGSRAIAELLEVPGASRTLLEAVVPYAPPAMIDWLGGRPDDFCSADTARAMAMAAFLRARELAASGRGPVASEAKWENGRGKGDTGHEAQENRPSPFESGAGGGGHSEPAHPSNLTLAFSGRHGVFGERGWNSPSQVGNPSSQIPHPSSSNPQSRIPDPAFPLAGVACTASLTSDRPKRGPHRVHVALQTAAFTAAWHLPLEKGRRTRVEEERLAGRLLLNAVAEACRVADRLTLDLVEGERVEYARVEAPPHWQSLLLGEVEQIEARGLKSEAEGAEEKKTQGSGGTVQDTEQKPLNLVPSAWKLIFPGSFHPLHEGHRRMFEIARTMLGEPAVWEISIVNVEKPPLDYIEIERRLGQFPPDETVVLSRAATFEEKSRLFAGATFIVGADTLLRIAEPRYYGGDAARRNDAVRRIAERGCRFLAFGRKLGQDFVNASDLDLPDALRALCRVVPGEVFCMNVSSSEIRNTGE